jgi:protein O-GlcNAc transferase
MKLVAEFVKQKQWGKAEQRLKEILAQRPSDAIAHFNLSYVLNQLGRNEEAIAALRRCIHITPTYLPALINLATLHEQVEDYKTALKFAIAAVKIAPRDAERHQQLSIIWSCLRNAHYALEANTNALALRPNAIEWRIRQMELLAFLKRPDDALSEAYRILASPGHSDNLGALLTINSILRDRSDWTGLSAIQTSLMQALKKPDARANPSSLMLSIDDPELIYRIGVRDAELTLKKRLPRMRAPTQTCDTSTRLVLGYLTADIREHPVAQMLLDILKRHDRARFEIVLLAIAPVGDSAIATSVSALFDRTLDLTQDTNFQAADRIRKGGINILIDLMGATSGARADILRVRPCETQLLWLGCPVTTCTESYDAFLVDEVIAPAGYEAHCSEPLFRLPCCYHPISYGLRPTPSVADRESFRLPSQGIIVGLLQACSRITSEFIERLARAIAPHPEAHLLLRVNVKYRESASRCLAEWGIPQHRIHFIQHIKDRSDYLRLIELLDLAIDSHPYGGHSTTGEALSLGVPVLAYAGRCIHSRVGASMMQDMGLSDLVTTSLEDQMDTLGQLLRNPEKLSQWKRRFASAANQPADIRHARLTKALEDAYVEMFDKTQNNSGISAEPDSKDDKELGADGDNHLIRDAVHE